MNYHRLRYICRKNESNEESLENLSNEMESMIFVLKAKLFQKKKEEKLTDQ